MGELEIEGEQELFLCDQRQEERVVEVVLDYWQDVFGVRLQLLAKLKHRSIFIINRDNQARQSTEQL